MTSHLFMPKAKKCEENERGKTEERGLLVNRGFMSLKRNLADPSKHMS